MRAGSGLKTFWGILLLLYLVRLAVAVFGGGIHVDEAYYVVWAKHLKLGYYDHPPMIAWLIRLGQSFVPEAVESTELGAKFAFRWLPTALASIATPWLLFRALERYQGRAVSAWQIAALVSAPLFVFGPQVLTPDIPFFLLWTAVLYGLIEVERRPSRASLIALGLCLGLAGLSKYSAVLAALLVVAWRLGWRQTLLCGVTAFLVFLPHLFWQFGGSDEAAKTGGLLFQLRNGLGNVQGPVQLHLLAEMWAVQFIFWSPLVFIAFFRLAWRRPQDWRLSLAAILPLLFFSVTALHRRVEGNWPLIGVLAALVLVLAHASPRLLRGIVVTNLVTSVFGGLLLLRSEWLVPFFRAVAPPIAAQLTKPSRLHEFEGWDELRSDLQRATAEDAAPIRVQSYQVLAALLFYDGTVPVAERLGSRLRFWTRESRGSEFNFLPDYRDQELPHSPAWIFAPGDAREDKGDCRFRAPLDKRGRPFGLWRC